MVMSEVCMVVCMLTVLSITDAELHANSNIEDMEAIVAEITGLMDKIKRLNERQLRAKQQAKDVAEQAAKKRESLKNENVSVTTCMVEVGGRGRYNQTGS